MSNYFFAMGNKRQVNKLSTMFQSTSDIPEQEITIKKTVRGLWVLVVQSGQSQPIRDIRAAIDDPEPTQFFFRGWFQNHDTTSLILGGDGAAEYFTKGIGETSPLYPLNNDGMYSLFAWDKERLQVQNDLYALSQIAWTATPSIFIASDSLFIVSRARKWLSLPCSLNRQVALAKGWRTYGIASAPLSSETIISEVKIVATGRTVEIDLKRLSSSNPLQFLRREKPVSTIQCQNLLKLFSSEVEYYEAALALIVGRMHGVLRRLSDITELPINFGLSGGLDSRVILATVLSDSKIRDNLNIRSGIHPHQTVDLEIATELSQKFNFPLNQPRLHQTGISASAVKRLTEPNKFGLWVLGNLGLYDSMFFENGSLYGAPQIGLGGQGGETIKDTWGGDVWLT